jgi:hypothetical protein
MNNVIQRDVSKMKSKEDDSPTGTLPRSGVRLDHVTKDRVRGPQGRRLPRKPNKSIGAEMSVAREAGGDSLLGSEEDCTSGGGGSTTVRDARGRATSLSALESSSETHPKVRLEFQLGSEDDTLANNNRNSSYLAGDVVSSFPSPDPYTNRLSFEQAWFITLPDSHPPTLYGSKANRKSALDEDVDNTSDYSSMHGSPPSTKSHNSKRSPSASPTHPPGRSSIGARIQKFLCSLL